MQAKRPGVESRSGGSPCAMAGEGRGAWEGIAKKRLCVGGDSPENEAPAMRLQTRPTVAP